MSPVGVPLVTGRIGAVVVVVPAVVVVLVVATGAVVVVVVPVHVVVVPVVVPGDVGHVVVVAVSPPQTNHWLIAGTRTSGVDGGGMSITLIGPTNGPV